MREREREGEKELGSNLEKTPYVTADSLKWVQLEHEQIGVSKQRWPLSNTHTHTQKMLCGSVNLTGLMKTFWDRDAREQPVSLHRGRRSTSEH